jgi:putative CocE/NonD family hydrolase
MPDQGSLKTIDETHPGIIVEKNVPVTMADGTQLMADVFRPKSPDPVPVLVYRTPYGKHLTAGIYTTHINAVNRGYAVILQDVRGRYASQGLFEPYQNEGQDGYDTIEWAAKQPWSNGRVGSYGLSYPGAVQWLAALRSPPHLEAMAPAMTFSSPRNFFYMNGVFDLSWLPWTYINIAPDARVRLDLPGIRDVTEASAAWPGQSEAYQSFLPLAELPYLRREAPFYFQWLNHPPEDRWWDWGELRGQYERVNAAVLNLSGWYDEAYGPGGAITNFKGLIAARAGEADPRTHLVMGPWVHGVESTMTSEIGDLDFGPQAAIDYDALILDFFDHYLKDMDNSFSRSQRVRQFVMGENQWHEQSGWPQRENSTETLYLEANQQSGLKLVPTAGNGLDESSFVSDPAKPVTDPYQAFGPHDYQSLAARPDVLVFETAPLTEDMVVSGAIETELFVSCDCRDLDLWVKLLDVYPDGRAYNLMSPGADVLRASYRDQDKGRQLLEPGVIYPLSLPGLVTSNRFAAGHRIRVQISGSFAPHLSRNLQTGESEIFSRTSQPATIRIHHSESYPSKLVLPVSRPGSH